MRVFMTLLIICSLILAGFVAIGFYLSPQDELQKADIALVVSGGETDARIREGVKIYAEGYVPLLLFAGAAAQGEISNAAAMRSAAIDQGVPAEAIIIEERSKTTIENAVQTKPIIAEQDIRRIILITSPYHQRRAYDIFRAVLGPSITIINHSSVDSNWRKRSWWLSGYGWRRTVEEVGGLIYFHTLGETAIDRAEPLEETYRGVQQKAAA